MKQATIERISEVISHPNADRLDLGYQCVTIIKDFDGDIQYEIKNEEAYLEGTGNVNFYTQQTRI